MIENEHGWHFMIDRLLAIRVVDIHGYWFKELEVTKVITNLNMSR